MSFQLTSYQCDKPLEAPANRRGFCFSSNRTITYQECYAMLQTWEFEWQPW
jgi:hypothetical protein